MPVQPAAAGASAGNFAGTMALAMCAIGLTGAMYVANWRRAHRGPAGEGKGSSGGGGGGGANSSSDGQTDSGGGNAAASVTAGGGGASPSVTAAAAASAAAREGRDGQRGYYSIRAEHHVRRHNANLVEWCDPGLGVAIPFSPILFAVTREERQAPMVLLTLKYLRQPSHQISIAFEELYEPQPPDAYREASLTKILECSRILSSAPIRIASENHPSAEYCYVDAYDQINYVMAVFVTHDRLALTVQYSANTRVRNLLPTAFYELIRAVRFSLPRPTPSYLLVSEPRLGLGFRLGLDFTVYEGLADGAEGWNEYSGLVGSGSNAYGSNHNGNNASYPPRGSSVSMPRVSTGGGGSMASIVESPRDLSFNASVSGGGGGGSGGGAFSSPFATAVGRGTRRMGLIACYEPAASPALSLPYLTGNHTNHTTANSTGNSSSSNNIAGRGASASNPLWHQFLSQQMQLAVQRLGIRLDGPFQLLYREANNTNSNSGGGKGSGKQTEEPPLPGQVVMRPYQLSLSRRGNFTSNDDDDDYYYDEADGGDGDARRTVTVTGSCCLQEVRLEASSRCHQLIRDSLDQMALVDNSHYNTNSNNASPAYLGIFYVPVRDECISVTFVASALRHSFEEFVSWCSATMQSATLGNHVGQGTSILYCNLRHEVLPFTVALVPGRQVVEEPQLGDPLAIVSTYGAERTTALVRAFPLRQLIPSSASGTGTPARVPRGGGGGGLAPPPPAAVVPPPLPSAARPSPGASMLPLAHLNCNTSSHPQQQGARAFTPSPSPLPPPPQRERHRYRAQLRVLEHMLRGYLSELPERVSVRRWERCSVRGRPAMRFCFEQQQQQQQQTAGMLTDLNTTGTSDGGGNNANNTTSGGTTTMDGNNTLTNATLNNSSSASLGAGVGIDELDTMSVGTADWITTRTMTLEEEVGSINPFSRYYPPPPPALGYLGLRPPPSAAELAALLGGNNSNINSSGGKGRGSMSFLSTAASRVSAHADTLHRHHHLSGNTTNSTNSTAAAVASLPSFSVSGGGGGGGGCIGGSSDGAPLLANGSQASYAGDDCGGDDTLRVGVVVCGEGHAFMFIASCSVYSHAVAEQAVQELASQFALRAAVGL